MGPLRQPKTKYIFFEEFAFQQGRPRIAKPRMMKENGAKKRTAHFFFALCCLGKIPGGAPFSQLHKSGNGSRVDRP